MQLIRFGFFQQGAARVVRGSRFLDGLYVSRRLHQFLIRDFNASASFLMVAGFGTPRLPFSIREIPAALTPEYVASWFTVRCLFPAMSAIVSRSFPQSLLPRSIYILVCLLTKGNSQAGKVLTKVNKSRILCIRKKVFDRTEGEESGRKDTDQKRLCAAVYGQ